MKPKAKPDIKKMIENIKLEKERNPMRIDIDYSKPRQNVRDMRREAMDMGSHGAKEIFGGEDAGTV